MWLDPIVAEIHQTRDQISEAYGDDMHAIFAAAQRGELAKPLIATLGDAAPLRPIPDAPVSSRLSVG